MRGEILQKYLDGVYKRTGAKFVIDSMPETTWTNYDGDSTLEKQYIKARVRLDGTKFTMTMIWSESTHGGTWRRGR